MGPSTFSDNVLLMSVNMGIIIAIVHLIMIKTEWLSCNSVSRLVVEEKADLIHLTLLRLKSFSAVEDNGKGQVQI